MPRYISFAICTDQIRRRSKTVTRRSGWQRLKVGETLNACVKCQGLRRGEKIERLCQIRVVDVRRELLRRMTDDLAYGLRETTFEGFPEEHPNHDPTEFVKMFCGSHGGTTPDSTVTRIEFEYADECGSRP